MALAKKVKASTLMETLVAMVVSMITLTFGTLVFVKVMDSSHQPEKLSSKIGVDKIASESIKEKQFIDAKLKQDELTIVKSVMPYKGSKTLNQISVKAFNNQDKLVAERNELIIIE